MDTKMMWASLCKRFDIPADKHWILDSGNVQALYAAVRTLDVNPELTEVPMFTILRMASLQGVDLTESEVEAGIRHLVEAGLLSLRIGSFSTTEMISLSSMIKPI